MGNSFAIFMLFAWPIVVFVLFRSLPLVKAIVISVVAGYLLLPTSPTFNLPLLPAYGKSTAIMFPILIMTFVATRAAPLLKQKEGEVYPRWRWGWLPQEKRFLICFLVIFVAGVFTVLTNSDAIQFTQRTLPGLRPYDAASLTLTTFVTLLPFLVARKFLARPKDHAVLIAIFAVAALLYSLPALWEVRMSPRLNAQIYGFFPHDWRQHQRHGGFRPLVFLEHGLRLGVFFAIGALALAAVTLRIGDRKKRQLAVFGLVWLLAVLVLSKNLTAFIIVCVLLPVLLFLRPRGQALVAGALAASILFYPMMRAANLVPIETITSALSTVVDPRRVSSLNFRIKNEDMLLEKANERPAFGWGGWARARVYDHRGHDISTTDGTWIIEYGEKGLIGYLARFGLLTIPVIILALRRGREPLSSATAALAIMLVANLIDMLPNSGLSILTWMMAGALTGYLETHKNAPKEARRRVPDKYSRFSPSHVRAYQSAQEPPT